MECWSPTFIFCQTVPLLDKIIIGSQQVLPIVLVSYVAGGLVEVVFQLSDGILSMKDF